MVLTGVFNMESFIISVFNISNLSKFDIFNDHVLTRNPIPIKMLYF